jgi:hypothetical protein
MGFLSRIEDGVGILKGGLKIKTCELPFFHPAKVNQRLEDPKHHPPCAGLGSFIVRTMPSDMLYKEVYGFAV